MPENLDNRRNRIEQTNPVFSEREIVAFQNETVSYLQNLLGKNYEFLRVPKMKEEIAQFGAEEYQKLSSALSDMGWNEKIPASNDTMGLVRVAAGLVAECQSKTSELFGKETQKLADEATDIVSEKYGVDVRNIIKKAEVTAEAKEPVIEDVSEQESQNPLPENLVQHAEKKFLVDLYIHGKSLNDLGGMYAYFQEKGWQDNALHRATASALHIVNAKTAMQFASQGMLPKMDAMISQNKDQSPQLGRVEMESDEEGSAGFKAEGMTASELAHEEIKGLLEYISLDTALPAKGEITDDEARLLKSFLEKPSLEILGGVYGPILSNKIDSALAALLETKDEKMQNRIGSLIDTSSIDLKKPVSFLRLYKVFTMQNGENIIQSYREVLEKESFGEARIASFEKAEAEYRNSL